MDINNIYWLSDYNHRTYRQRSTVEWFNRIGFTIKSWCHNYYIEYDELRKTTYIKNKAGERKGIVGYKIYSLQKRIENKKLIMNSLKNNPNRYGNLKGQIYEMEECIRIYKEEYRLLEMWLRIGKLLKGDKNANLLI